MSDPRFTRLKTDPRFRRPRTKQTKVVVDERFKSVFDMSEKDKQKGKKVDKYGRRVSSKQDQENLRRFYRLENEDEEAQGEPEDADAGPRRPDYARGEGLVESSSEEEDESDMDDGPVILGADEGSSKLYKPSQDEEDLEIDLNEDASDAEIDPKELKRRYAALDAQAAGTRFEDEDEEKDDQVPEADRTSRLAIVNLDWDHVRAHHLYKICASLVSSTAPIVKASTSKPTLPDSERAKQKGKEKIPLESQITIARGKILSVRVYPSEFGKGRMAREEKEGPPPEVFKRYKRDQAIEKGLLDAEDITVNDVYEVGAEGEEEYDEDALRKYQIERLRYYYAIVECDTVGAASHIYNELQGTELERSANVFDMSFVPDGMEFDSEPRDEATDELNTGYKAVEFVTDALRHSKVKLTWDDDDPERNKVTRRTLTQKEIEEQDFRNYIANSSDSSSDEDEQTKQNDKGSKKGSKKDKKKAERERLRVLLLGGGGGDDMPEGWGPGDPFGNDDDGDIDMEITFSSALSGKKANEDETTLEKYQRKMREKRKKRREEVKEKGAKEEDEKDEFFEGSSGGEEEKPKEKSKSKGDKRRKDKEEAGEEASARKEATAEELALLVASDNPNAGPKHFSLKSVINAEKGKKRKGKKNRKGEDNEEAQEDFVMDVKDERFKALHEDHEFAIDPTNPHFKKTKSMAALLNERQKRQQSLRGERPDSRSGRVERDVPSGGKSLQSLVESVKRKSQATDQPRQGKRRKL